MSGCVFLMPETCPVFFRESVCAFEGVAKICVVTHGELMDLYLY
jgi:hypothetical protein